MKDERYRLLENGVTCVANLDSDSELVLWAKARGLATYVGRYNRRRGLPESLWHNPFHLKNKKSQKERHQVCERHKDYLMSKPALLSRIHELKGRLLCCYCYPEKCHADALAAAANGSTIGPEQPNLFTTQSSDSNCISEPANEHGGKS